MVLLLVDLVLRLITLFVAIVWGLTGMARTPSKCHESNLGLWFCVALAALTLGVISQIVNQAFAMRNSYYWTIADGLGSVVRLFFLGWMFYGIHLRFYEGKHDYECFKLPLKAGIDALLLYGALEITKLAVLLLVLLCCLPFTLCVIGFCPKDFR